MGFINKTALHYSGTLFCLEAPTSSQLQTEPFQCPPRSHFYPLRYVSSLYNYDRVESEISRLEAV